MKNLFLLIFSILTINIFAQSKADSTNLFHLSSVEISSGKGAISSGVYLYFNLESDKVILQTTLSEKDVEVTYFYRLFKDKVLIGPNVGYFHNVPYAASEMIFSPTEFLSILNWDGYSLGKPDGKIESQPIFLFAVDAISLNVWRFKATYCLINYMKNEPQHTATLSYSQDINPKFSVHTDVGYDFLNQTQLLKIGISWRQ